MSPEEIAEAAAEEAVGTLEYTSRGGPDRTGRRRDGNGREIIYPIVAPATGSATYTNEAGRVL